MLVSRWIYDTPNSVMYFEDDHNKLKSKYDGNLQGLKLKLHVYKMWTHSWATLKAYKKFGSIIYYGKNNYHVHKY